MEPTRRRFLQTSSLLGGAIALTEGIATATGVPTPTRYDLKPPSFLLGIVTYNIAKDWDLDTILQVCRNVGLAAVECRTSHKHGVEPTLSKDKRREIKKKFADSGVVFWGCGSVCEFHSPNAEEVRRHVEDCKAFVELVADLGGKGVKVRPNGLPKEVEKAKTLAQIGKALAECGKAAQSAGVEIWVEVHGPQTQLPENMKAIMEECGHPAVGICWNSNPTDVVKGSVAESFALLKPWLKSCHVNELYKEATGAYPYRQLFSLMREANYDRVALVEVGKSPSSPSDGEELLRYAKALFMHLASG